MLLEDFLGAIPYDRFSVESIGNDGKFITLLNGPTIIKIEYYNEYTDVFCSVREDRSILFSERIQTAEELTRVLNKYIK
jgi:hypothetical protein